MTLARGTVHDAGVHLHWSIIWTALALGGQESPLPLPLKERKMWCLFCCWVSIMHVLKANVVHIVYYHWIVLTACNPLVGIECHRSCVLWREELSVRWDEPWVDRQWLAAESWTAAVPKPLHGVSCWRTNAGAFDKERLTWPAEDGRQLS